MERKTVMEYVISAFWFALEYIAFHFMLSAFFPKKPSAPRYWVNYLIFWITYILIAMLELPRPIELILFFSGFCTLCLLNYRGSALQVLLVTAVTYLFAAVFDSLVLYGVSAFLQISLADFIWRKLQYTSVVTMGKLLNILLGWVLYRIRRSRNIEKIHTKWLLLTILFPLLSILMILYVYTGFRNQADLSVGVMGLSVVIAAANVGIVYLIHTMERSAIESQQSALLQMQMEIQTDGILALEKNYRAQRKATHEFRNQLQTIYDLLLLEDCTAARDYVREIQEMQPTRAFAVNSHHPVLDAVLNHKYQIAQEYGIQVDMKVNDLSSLAIESNYLVVLMSNLLDNAIEACKILEKDRCIRCSVVYQDSLFISVRNTSSPVTIVGNSIPTTKEQKKDHGYGVPHIQHIVSLLGGEYAFSYDDGWFDFAIEIPVV